MDILKEIIGQELDVHMRDSKGNSAFHLAAVHPRCTREVVTLLLELGSPLNTANNNGQTPLHLFVQNRQIPPDVIELLLDNQAAVNTLDKFHNSPLHYALDITSPRDTNVVKLLLNKGSNVHEQNMDQEQPLHLAAELGNLELIRLLLDYEVDVNAVDVYYQTPLFHALYSFQCKASVVRLLLESGADVRQRNDGGEQPLHVAAYKCGAGIVKMLLDRGADPNSLDNDIQSPMNHALNALKCDPEVVRALLDGGADIHTVDENGDQILHLAVCTCRAEIVKIFLDHGAFVNALNNGNMSPLHFALSSDCDPNVIRLLVAEGADVHLENHRRQTPLHLAALYADPETVQFLLDQGASVNALQNMYFSPLTNALFNHNDNFTLAILKLLLEYGAHVYHGVSSIRVAVDVINQEPVRKHPHKFKKALQWCKLLLKYAVIEEPLPDFKKVCDDYEIAVDLQNFGSLCLMELSSKCIGETNLGTFIVKERGNEIHDVNKILQVLSTKSCVVYKEVIGSLLTTPVLKEKLTEQIETMSCSYNRSKFSNFSVMLNYECFSSIMNYISSHDDLLNLTLAFHTLCDMK